MNMPQFNKIQVIFLIVVMLFVTFMVGNFLSYYWHFKSILKVSKHFEWWKIFEIISQSYVPINVKIDAFKALSIGFCVSLMCPVIGYAMMFKKGDISLYGSAKFASLKDIQNSNSVSIDPNNTKGIVVGKYQGKLVNASFVLKCLNYSWLICYNPYSFKLFKRFNQFCTSILDIKKCNLCIFN